MPRRGPARRATSATPTSCLAHNSSGSDRRGLARERTTSRRTSALRCFRGSWAPPGGGPVVDPRRRHRGTRRREQRWIALRHARRRVTQAVRGRGRSPSSWFCPPAQRCPGRRPARGGALVGRRCGGEVVMLGRPVGRFARYAVRATAMGVALAAALLWLGVWQLPVAGGGAQIAAPVDLPRGIEPLGTVRVPRPQNVGEFVKDESAGVVLGK